MALLVRLKCGGKFRAGLSIDGPGIRALCFELFLNRARQIIGQRTAHQNCHKQAKGQTHAANSPTGRRGRKC